MYLNLIIYGPGRHGVSRLSLSTQLDNVQLGGELHLAGLDRLF
jgi:hypothetical protein